MSKSTHDNRIYHTDSADLFRYALGRAGYHPLVCLGVNPSTATPTQSDATITRVARRAELRGYDSWLMLNVSPQRATNPNHLDQQLPKEHHERNVHIISNLLSEGNFDVWAAWGNLIDSRPYLLHCLSDIVHGLEGISLRWIRVGEVTKRGHPRHPRTLPYAAPLVSFDIHEYLDWRMTSV